VKKRLVFAIVVIAAIGAAVLVMTTCFPRWDDRAMPWPAKLPACDGFDFPVGAPEAAGYHDMLEFSVEGPKGFHLGNDWTGNGGDNDDLGAPVHAIANGIVIDARDIAGEWGNVVRIAHGCGVESVYAHLEQIDTTLGATVKRGARIGTIGDADGEYKDAHLHLEIRDRALPLGGGYYNKGEDITGYLDPTAYIRANRPAPSQQR